MQHHHALLLGCLHRHEAHAIRSAFQSLTPGERETIKQVAAKTINDREIEITPEQKQQAKAIADQVWSSLTPEQQQKMEHAASVAEGKAKLERAKVQAAVNSAIANYQSFISLAEQAIQEMRNN